MCMYQQHFLSSLRRFYFAYLYYGRRLPQKSYRMAVMDWLNWSLGAMGAVGTVYGVYATKKSKRFQKVEEDGELIDNADKIVAMWGKLSENYTAELKELKQEFKEVTKLYNDLRVEFEVLKQTNEFVIQQKETRIKELEADVKLLSMENTRLKEQLPMGTIKNIS